MVPARRSARGLHARSASSSPRHGLRAVGPRAGVQPLPRWVSVAGLEFGAEREGFGSAALGRAGEDWFLNGRQTYERLAALGFRGFRVPFRWERLQPELHGPLAPDGVQALRNQLNLARRVGGEVLLDLHNGGRYHRGGGDGVEVLVLGEERAGRVELGPSELADLWSRMAHAFKGQPGLAGYGLMNEPHDLSPGAWRLGSRAAAEAIRDEGDQATLFVAGDRWSSAAHWRGVNPAGPWIDDPLERVVYEAHCYLDRDGSGRYALSFDEEQEFDAELSSRAEARLTPFLDWLEASDARGFLGEFGVPSADPAWCALLRPMLERLDAAGVECAWWAAGERWGDHPLSLQPGRKGSDLRPAERELFLD
jgi:endoglucanase